MIADNSTALAAAIGSRLSELGFAVECAPKNGRALADRLSLGGIDAVISDIILQELDLIAVLELLHEKQIIPPAVFAVSGFDDPAVEARVIQAGATYYFLKPADAGLIAARVAEFVGVNSTAICSELESRVSSILIDVGIPPHIKGFTYLKFGIALSVRLPELLFPITSGLYVRIAQHYGTTAVGVERAIRTAIDMAYNKTLSFDALQFCFGSHSRKLTNSEFISILSERLRSSGDTLLKQG